MRKAINILVFCWLSGCVLIMLLGFYEAHLDETAKPGTARYERVHNGDETASKDKEYDFISTLLIISTLLFLTAPFILVPIALFESLKTFLGYDKHKKARVTKPSPQMFVNALGQEIRRLEKELEEQRNICPDYRQVEKLNKVLEEKKAALEKLRGTSSKTS